MKKVLLIILTLMVISACDSQKKDYVVTLVTEYGDIKLILYDQTPKHKENFIKLAKEGRYDSTIFHRVIRQFMIQGGNVNAKLGNTDSINYLIPAEFVDTLFHHRGALAAARQSDYVNPQKKSNGSQFYIVHGKVFTKEELTVNMEKVNAYLRRLAEVPGYENVLTELDSIYRNHGNDQFTKTIVELLPAMEERFGTSFTRDMDPEKIEAYTTVGGAPHLDGAYTVFGRVVEGMEVVDKIASVPTNMADWPVEKIFITVEVEEMPKDEWQKKYGGSYY